MDTYKDIKTTLVQLCQDAMVMAGREFVTGETHYRYVSITAQKKRTLSRVDIISR